MKKPTVYGYARVSTGKQNIERQITNIKEQYPQAVIIQESFTGTKMNRPAWNRLYKKLGAGDTVVFDEVSRMSRNAEEGFTTYQELYNRGVDLIFLKESYIDTSVYRDATKRRISVTMENTGSTATDNLISGIMEVLNRYNMDIIKEQIARAFMQAQAEVDHLHQRTSEGVQRAIAEGKQVGRATGATVTTKKSIAAKDMILKYHKDFGGNLNDVEVMKMIGGIARNSYYKYKRELTQDLTADQE